MYNMCFVKLRYIYIFFCLFVCVSVYLSIYLSIYLFIYLSIYLSIYLHIYVYVNGCINLIGNTQHQIDVLKDRLVRTVDITEGLWNQCINWLKPKAFPTSEMPCHWHSSASPGPRSRRSSIPENQSGHRGIQSLGPQRFWFQ